MTNQKRTLEEIKYGRLWAEIELPKPLERGKKNMNEEIKPETKDQQETPKPELLVLKTGYNQHASPLQLHTTLLQPEILNILLRMENEGFATTQSDSLKSLKRSR